MTSLESALRTNESHIVEFKKSTGLAAEIAQTVVAFANAPGGDIFVGVTPGNDPKVVGITIGNTTLENLANNLESHIYPHSPARIEVIAASNDKSVVQVIVPPDRPPLVGCYLYNPRAMDPDTPVSAIGLEAFRRVGRVNRMVPNFMTLRTPLPSDPTMVISYRGSQRGNVVPRHVGGSAWLTDGSAMAHSIRFSVEPRGCRARRGAKSRATGGSPWHWLR